MAAFKPAYLIHGDDHGRIGERRSALRALAERESGSGGVECLAGDAATPEAVAGALAAMTFALGRRFIVVDGAERWKDADVKTHLVPALKAIAPETTVAFFAREEGRFKAPPALAAAVERAGGSVAAERTLKARELPRWLQGEAAKLGVDLQRDGAQALVALVGERQQRLLREVEKLALELGDGARIGADEVEEAAARSSERQVWGLVDALVAGDGAAATRAYLELEAQGEAVTRLVGLLARRVRDVLAIAARLDAGERPAQIKQGLKMSPWAADRRIAEARRSDVDRLSLALEALADLELATHGASELSDGTEAIRAIARITTV
jgi:DNA polymerase-3 subunit delta